MSLRSTIRDMDLAWERVNALGGTPCCAHDNVYNLAINDCLRIIESLGGSDPAARRKARQSQDIGDGMRCDGTPGEAA